jgi:ribose/xylose/arabinose/galactoside ABC-type transport system permease subunit
MKNILRTISLLVESIVLVTIALQVLFVIFVPRYTSGSNILLLLRSIPTLGVIALPVCMLMIAGEFDLSTGSTFALAPLVAIILIKSYGINVWFAFFVSLCLGAGIGLINGIITVKTKIPSFITTLATLMVWRGVVLIVSDAKPIAFHPGDAFKAVFNGTLFGVIPTQFIWFVGLTVLFWFIINKHTFGNHVISTGGNKRVARALGINTDSVKIICFMITGCMAAFAGSFDAARIATVFPVQGEGLELSIIAAVVIGGTKLMGGEGTILGTFLGATIIYTIEDVLLLLRVRAYFFRFFIGIVILVAVIMNVTVGERRKAYE